MTRRKFSLAAIAFGDRRGSRCPRAGRRVRQGEVECRVQGGLDLVGPHTDGGWSQAHDAGRAVRPEGARLEGCRPPTRRTCPRARRPARSIDSLVHDGNQIIFATSFGYQDCMVSEAKKYPNVKFEQATGYKLAKNLVGVLRRG